QIAKVEPEMDSISFVSYTKGTVKGLASENNTFYYCTSNINFTTFWIHAYKPGEINPLIYNLPKEIRYPSCVEIISGCFWVIDLGNRTLYKLKKDSTLSSEREVLINSEETLFQNYPHPFNPTTQIQYIIPSSSNVIVTVYNSLGQTVKVFNEGIKEAGNHNISFNGEGLSSGIYLYSVHSVSIDGKQNFTAAKKMLLLK
ncbi:MAG: T9SS type A sorting domain-containing protein, partial [Ignavibacteria bacterium]|nr:T9SS type A sorting domain-containing protein [Ignavibacteria bacterium]